MFHQLASFDQMLQVHSEPWLCLPICNIATDDLLVTPWTELLMAHTKPETPITSRQIYQHLHIITDYHSNSFSPHTVSVESAAALGHHIPIFSLHLPTLFATISLYLKSKYL
jgi:hypothetical protein